jgi:hypothetical protein
VNFIVTETLVKDEAKGSERRGYFFAGRRAVTELVTREGG